MILNYLELNNFRQFIGKQRIEFASDLRKNITIILANNTVGKTTLAQSFSWILYGDTTFKKSEIFNKRIIENLQPFSHTTAEAQVSLSHLNVRYIITRNQIARRAEKNVVYSPTTLVVEIIDKGISTKLYLSDAEKKIEDIMPRNLFSYFFFDGEKIERIGEEIETGKSKSFAMAVKGMLGFNALYAASDHLKGLVTKYHGEYDKNVNDTRFIEITQNIDRLESEIEKNERKIDLATVEIDNLEQEINKIHAQIVLNGDIGEKQERSKELDRIIKTKIEEIHSKEKAVFTSFSIKAYDFLSMPLLYKALQIVNSTEVIDAGIPGIYENAIKHLLERGECICGTSLSEGSTTRDTLQHLIKYLPPNSIGHDIKLFKVLLNKTKNNADDYENNFANMRKELSRDYSSLSKMHSDLSELNEEIANTTDIKALKDQERNAKSNQRFLIEKKAILKRDIERGQQDLEIEKKKKASYQVTDEKNKKIQFLETVTTKILDRLVSFIKLKEQDKRSKLQETMNEIYTSIYNDDDAIQIDESYNIKVTTKEVNDNVEASTSQLVSITFSFIMGVIRMAKDKISKGKNESLDDLEDSIITEPYPLVMDAPLSSFDKTRIRNVCSLFTKLDQVVIFIKDTDGDLAKEYMIDNIGASYRLDKTSKFSTVIERSE